MKKAKEPEGPIGPNGEFMTFGYCKTCGKYGTIYLYGAIKGICGRCVKPPEDEENKKGE